MFTIDMYRFIQTESQEQTLHYYQKMSSATIYVFALA